MFKKATYVLLVTLCFFFDDLKSQDIKVDWEGLFRVDYVGTGIDGPVLEADTTNGFVEDTLSDKSGSNGTVLFDFNTIVNKGDFFNADVQLRFRFFLGGDNDEVGNSGVLLRNAHFYGNIGKVIDYDIGDIFVGYSPLTIYNDAEDFHEFESSIFAFRRDILRYESFYQGNDWRFQGIHLLSKRFQLGEVVNSVKFNQLGTILNNNLDSDRFLLASKADIRFINKAKLGFNWVKVFDNKASVNDSISDFSNDVFASNLEFELFDDSVKTLKLNGEGAYSINNAFSKTEQVGVEFDGIATYVNVYGELKKLGLSVELGYRYVSLDFFNPTAQSLRFNVNDVPPFGGLMNGDRQSDLLDRVSYPSVYNRRIRARILAYNPIYGNITPYGMATPNRTGFSASLRKKGKGYSLLVASDLLTEVAPVNDSIGDTRKFTGIRGGVALDIHEFLGFQKMIKLTLGGKFENTKRGAAAPVDFTSVGYDGGIEVEFIKKVSFLLGVKGLTGASNIDGALIAEYIPNRDELNRFGFPTPYFVDASQLLLSGAVRWYVSEGVQFTFDVNHMDYNDREEADGDSGYKMWQVFGNFIISF